MKRVSRIVLMVAVLGFVFGMTLGLNAEDKAAVKKEDCGKELKCTMCKTPIDKEKAQFKSEYKGGIYYFASEKCKAEFDKTPEKYANSCHFKTAFTCPMKQCNVTQDKAGKCPKCGMDLKQVEEKACVCGTDKKECPGHATHEHK